MLQQSPHMCPDMSPCVQFSKETVQLAAEFLDSMPYNERYPLHYAIYILDMEQVALPKIIAEALPPPSTVREG